MKKNEGAIDRILRVLLALAAFATAYFWTTGALSIILYIVGAILLFTAITGFCLLYKPFGISTLKK